MSQLVYHRQTPSKLSPEKNSFYPSFVWPLTPTAKEGSASMEMDTQDVGSQLVWTRDLLHNEWYNQLLDIIYRSIAWPTPLPWRHLRGKQNCPQIGSICTLCLWTNFVYRWGVYHMFAGIWKPLAAELITGQWVGGFGYHPMNTLLLINQINNMLLTQKRPLWVVYRQLLAFYFSNIPHRSKTPSHLRWRITCTGVCCWGCLVIKYNLMFRR